MLRMACLTALLLSLVLPVAGFATPPDDDASLRRARLADSLSAHRRGKQAWSATERKLDSRLLRARQERRGQVARRAAGTRGSGVRWERDGTTLVDLRADVSDALLDAIVANGGTVVNAHPRYDAVRARLPESALEAVAARGDVRGVRPADRHVMRMVNTSEGDVAHRADDVRSILGIDGTGLSIGVLSDGVDTLAARQATGDLPPVVTVLAGAAGTGDEGTAMLEIVHDLAPGASLLYATALGGQAAFAANIIALEAAGADIIVDDVGYFAEPVFQDGEIADAIDSVTTLGALYLSAAGNDGNENKGAGGVWEGDFLDGGLSLHDFGGGVTENLIVEDSDLFALKWSDAQGSSANDYDLFLTDCAGNILTASETVQDGDDDPIESIDSTGFDDSGSCLAILKFSGSDRDLSLHTFGGELSASTSSSIYGHPGARGAVAVAATDWILAGGAGGEFDGSESVHSFSSDGPRRVHYEADGTPITAGDFSASGGELRSKPDVTGADCVTTATPGFAVFCGTSAAAPHVAAIAALLWEAGGVGTTAADVRTALETGTLDIEGRRLRPRLGARHREHLPGCERRAAGARSGRPAGQRRAAARLARPPAPQLVGTHPPAAAPSLGGCPFGNGTELHSQRNVPSFLERRTPAPKSPKLRWNRGLAAWLAQARILHRSRPGIGKGLHHHAVRACLPMRCVDAGRAGLGLRDGDRLRGHGPR